MMADSFDATRLESLQSSNSLQNTGQCSLTTILLFTHDTPDGINIKALTRPGQ